MLCISREIMLSIHLFPLPRTSLHTQAPSSGRSCTQGQQCWVPSGAVTIRYPHPARHILPIYHPAAYPLHSAPTALSGQRCSDTQADPASSKLTPLPCITWLVPGNHAQVPNPNAGMSPQQSALQGSSPCAASSSVMDSCKNCSSHRAPFIKDLSFPPYLPPYFCSLSSTK